MNQEFEKAVVKYGNETWEDGYGQGVYEEQERIIKLLKKKLFHTVYNDGEYPAVVNQQHFAGDIIALIKGQNK
jgi:hypothetical protein